MPFHFSIQHVLSNFSPIKNILMTSMYFWILTVFLSSVVAAQNFLKIDSSVMTQIQQDIWAYFKKLVHINISIPTRYCYHVLWWMISTQFSVKPETPFMRPLQHDWSLRFKDFQYGSNQSCEHLCTLVMCLQTIHRCFVFILQMKCSQLMLHQLTVTFLIYARLQICEFKNTRWMSSGAYWMEVNVYSFS